MSLKTTQSIDEVRKKHNGVPRNHEKAHKPHDKVFYTELYGGPHSTMQLRILPSRTLGGGAALRGASESSRGAGAARLGVWGASGRR